MATCFDRKTVIITSIENIVFLMYNKVSTQWDSILFTVKDKMAYGEILV